jgi:hypothetical protein
LFVVVVVVLRGLALAVVEGKLMGEIVHVGKRTGMAGKKGRR